MAKTTYTHSYQVLLASDKLPYIRNKLHIDGYCCCHFYLLGANLVCIDLKGLDNLLSGGRKITIFYGCLPLCEKFLINSPPPLFSFSEITSCNQELGKVIMQKILFIFTLMLLEVKNQYYLGFKADEVRSLDYRKIMQL